MADSDLDRLDRAYQKWHDSRGASTDAWLELLADEIDFGSLGAGTPGLKFSRAARSKSELVGYFEQLAADWEMVACQVYEYIQQGDRIVMLGRACWRHRNTGRVADSPKADVWQFKDGKAVAYFEFFDTAQASAATRPG